MGASCCSKVEGKNPQPGVYNYFQSGNPKEWRTNVRGYAEVVYHDVWPGIDLRIYGNDSDLEQEFIVQPGGDLSRVQITYRGIDGLSVAKDGSLEVATAFGTLRETKPRLYQQMATQKTTVDGRYQLISDRSYTFEVEAHNPLYALVVDPTLLYSTYLGGSAGNDFYSYNTEVATGIAVDASGSAYVAGFTASTNFPTTPGAFQVSRSNNGNWGGFITKLNATGSALVYSTYLGTASLISGIAIDATGDAYVTGYTAGTVFPTTSNAYWPTSSSQTCTSDFFVTELNQTGNQLVYSTCFNMGAGYEIEYSVFPAAIAVDSTGKVYIAGNTSGSVPAPTTPNAYQSYYAGMPQAGFISVFDTTASGTGSLFYSTYLGVPSGSGTGGSGASGIAVDSFGKIYVTGSAPPGFPVTPGAFQTVHSSASSDVFVAKLDPSISGQAGLLYSTYLGGGGVLGILCNWRIEYGHVL